MISGFLVQLVDNAQYQTNYEGDLTHQRLPPNVERFIPLDCISQCSQSLQQEHVDFPKDLRGRNWSVEAEHRKLRSIKVR